MTYPEICRYDLKICHERDRESKQLKQQIENLKCCGNCLILLYIGGLTVKIEARKLADEIRIVFREAFEG